MHVLLINDDGPPSPQSAPYVLPFVSALRKHTNHVISVVLPNRQRSWIGKAHMVGETLTPSFYNPSTGVISEDPQLDVTCAPANSHPVASKPGQEEEWVLVDGTPASCAQVGLHHFYQSRGPVDLVLSGPNYGRNTTAAFALSSGTIGGAQEAALCGFKAIALSFAFNGSSGLGTPALSETCELSVRIVQSLLAQWEDGVDLYNVNVPIIDGVSQNPIRRAAMLGNKWLGGSCFREASEDDSKSKEEGRPALHEQEIRTDQDVGSQPASSIKPRRKLIWAPRFSDVYDSVEKAGPGSDGWAVKEGSASITPLRANFMTAGLISGDFHL